MGKKVGVSNLAFYADNPKDFIQRRGRVKNKEAVAVGNKKHETLSSQTFPFPIAVFLTVMLIAVFFLTQDL
ncbi:MAG: hypothetical protein V3T17_05630 [Pseudomonadales bacterium]